MFKLKNIFISTVLFLFTISLSGCGDDDPVAPQEEHFEAIGMVFYTSGIQIAKILRGETNDTLAAQVGVVGDHIEIKFYDEEENIVDPPESEGQTLSWEIGDESFLEVDQDEGEEGSFEFHLEGISAGNTVIEFFIMHEGHPDFRSGKIPVRVLE